MPDSLLSTALPRRLPAWRAEIIRRRARRRWERSMVLLLWSGLIWLGICLGLGLLWFWSLVL